MTIKEAILKSLDEINDLTNYMDVYNHIVKNNFYDFGPAKTPASTISALLGDFIRNGDTRVKRIKQQGGTYAYYLTKNEQNIAIDVLSGETETEITLPKKPTKTKTYEERDLHKLLSSYLKNTDTYSKTIFHEQSNGKDNNQIWTHPDMVGMQLLAVNRANKTLNHLINAHKKKGCQYRQPFSVLTNICVETYKPYLPVLSGKAGIAGYLTGLAFNSSNTTSTALLS